MQGSQMHRSIVAATGTCRQDTADHPTIHLSFPESNQARSRYPLEIRCVPVSDSLTMAGMKVQRNNGAIIIQRLQIIHLYVRRAFAAM